MATVAVAFFARDGVISEVGPIQLEPALSVLIAAGVPSAIAIAITCTPPRVPVLMRTRRTVLARALAFGVVSIAAMGAVAGAAALSSSALVLPALRTLLALGAIGLLAATLISVQVAWMPVLLAFGTAVLSPVDAGQWSVHGFVLAEGAPLLQLILVASVFVVALTTAAFDPLCRAHLARAALR